MSQKRDIPQAEQTPVEQTDLELKELPGDWEWDAANRYSNGKVNVFFGLDIEETGGLLGEIDNYTEGDGEEKWDVHVRPIVELEGTEGNQPREAEETTEQFDSFADAIDSVPGHISTYYNTTR